MGESDRKPQIAKRNRLLSRLSDEDYSELVSACALVSLSSGTELCRTGDPTDAVYFPIDCAISVLVGAGCTPEQSKPSDDLTAPPPDNSTGITGNEKSNR